jgi:multidrug efflux system outer membrane protein
MTPRTTLLAGAAAVLGAVALSGCALGPRPSAPVVTPPAAWSHADAAADWPQADWWRALGSTELDGLIADAERQNDDLAAAAARVSEANAQAKIAGAALLPTVGVAPEAGVTRRISPIGIPHNYSTVGAVFTASYELDLWGKNRDLHNVALHGAAAARNDLAAAHLTVVASVASTYLRVLALQDQIAIAQSDADVGQKVLEGLQQQAGRGVVTGLTVVQQQTAVQTLQAAIPPLKAQRDHLLDALAILTGHAPEGFKVTTASLNDIKLPTVGAGLPSQLLTHRPDVQAAEQALAAADANIEAARASFLPSISLTGDGGIESMALQSAFLPSTSIYDLGLSVLQPIFDGGRLHGKLDYANARHRELAAQYAATAHAAFADVEDALAALHGAQAQLDDQRKAVASAEQALQMSRAAFAAGTTDVLPTFAAQQALLPARTAEDQAQLAEGLGVIDLYRALGGGWSLQE